MTGPHDELDPALHRAFAELPATPDDTAFVAAVTRRIAVLRRTELAWQAAQGALVVLLAAVLTPWVLQGTLWLAAPLTATPSAVVDLLLTPLGLLATLAFAGWRALEGRDALD